MQSMHIGIKSGKKDDKTGKKSIKTDIRGKKNLFCYYGSAVQQTTE